MFDPRFVVTVIAPDKLLTDPAPDFLPPERTAVTGPADFRLWPELIVLVDIAVPLHPS